MSPRRRSRVSERVYAALMHLYPRDFREQYGDEMLDLFRDRWNDEHSRSRMRGTLRMWSRTLVDVSTTALHEHIAARRARRALPNPHRDPMLQAFAQDLKFAGRMLRKNPVRSVRSSASRTPLYSGQFPV